MASVNISGKYMACDKVVAEHNQAELKDLTISTHFPFEIVRDRRLKR